MVKTTPNAQHCPSPAPGGLFRYRRGTERGVRLCLRAGNTPNYPKGSLEGGAGLGGAPCCSIAAHYLFFFNFPPLGSGVSRRAACPRKTSPAAAWSTAQGTEPALAAAFWNQAKSTPPPRGGQRAATEGGFFFFGGLPSRSGENSALEEGHQRVFWHPEAAPGLFASSSPRGERVSACGNLRGAQRICGVGRMEETPRRCRGRWKPFPCLLGGLVSPPASLGGCFGLCLCWEGALLKAIWAINCCKAAFPVLGWKCRGWRVPPVPPLGPSKQHALGSESQSLYLRAAF